MTAATDLPPLAVLAAPLHSDLDDGGAENVETLVLLLARRPLFGRDHAQAP
jgi:hypothetical protein